MSYGDSGGQDYRALVAIVTILFMITALTMIYFNKERIVEFILKLLPIHFR